MDKSMANEERLVGQGSDRWQYFRFADAPMIKKLGFVLLMVPFLTGLGPWERTPGVSFWVRCIPSKSVTGLLSVMPNVAR